LYFVEDGGYLLDTWYNVVVEFQGYSMTVRMDQERKMGASWEDLKDLAHIATVGDGTFPGGTIAYGVNNLTGFYVDDVTIMPNECLKTAVDENGFVFVPENCNRWQETFGSDINTLWKFVDPEESIQGPSSWRYSQRFSDYQNVIA